MEKNINIHVFSVNWFIARESFITKKSSSSYQNVSLYIFFYSDSRNIYLYVVYICSTCSVELVPLSTMCVLSAIFGREFPIELNTGILLFVLYYLLFVSLDLLQFDLLCYLWGIILYVILSFKKIKIFFICKKIIPKKVCLVLEKKCVKKTIILVMRSYCQQPQRPSMLPFEEAKKAVNRWDCNEDLCNQGFNKVDRRQLRLRTDPIRQPLMRLPASSVRLHSISAVKYLLLISFG